jgi:hypothetical protein
MGPHSRPSRRKHRTHAAVPSFGKFRKANKFCPAGAACRRIHQLTNGTGVPPIPRPEASSGSPNPF